VAFGVIDMREQETSKPSRFDRAVWTGRLQKLERMGLAQQISPGLWQLSGSMEDTLTLALSRQGDRYSDHAWPCHTGSTRHSLCCEPLSEERSAGNRHATF